MILDFFGETSSRLITEPKSFAAVRGTDEYVCDQAPNSDKFTKGQRNYDSGLIV